MEIRLLGPLEVVDGARRLEVRGAKQRALVALLALHAPNAVSDDRLLEELWGEELPDAPLNALQKQVSQLRKAIGADRLRRSSAGYAIDVVPADVDALAFERSLHDGRRALEAGEWERAATMLRDGLAAWRGPAMEDMADHAFAARHAVHLDALRVDAVEHRVEAELALGRHRELTTELDALVAAHPLRERLRAQLMVALYRSGRQAEALAAYQAGRRALAEELGLEPGPELQALERAILGHDPSLAAVGRVEEERAPAHATSAPPPRTSTAPSPSALPVALTTFVGREVELGQVTARLTEHRLVTVTGPGGAGKTRLALEAADALRGAAPATFVELAPVPSGSAVAEAVADAVGARDAGPQHAPGRPLERLVSHIGRSACVVVLDNCEHVLGDAARLVADVLAACPAARVLATSREPLGVPGEAQVPLGPLARDDACQLFTNRATAARPDFVADDRTLPHVVEICRRLDGLPLAIELAAARVKVLPVEHIARRLDDRFRLLTTGSRTVLPRHQTLLAAVEWSYDLLFEDERTAFARASVFAGSFDLEAAQAVVAVGTGLGELEVLDLVTRLVDKSLLTVVGDRYVMLETLRQFGAEQLEGTGRAGEVRRAHAEHFAELAVTAEAHLFTPDQLGWLSRLEDDHDNLRAAIGWSLTAAPAVAMVLAAALATPWWLRGHAQEARHVLDAALDADRAPSSARAKALRWAAQLSDATGWSQHPQEAQRELARAKARLEEAMAMAEALGDRSGLAHARRMYAVGIVRESGFQQSADVLERAMAHLAAAAEEFRFLDDPLDVGYVGVVEGFVALACGDLPRADAAVRRVEPELRQLGDRFSVDRALLVRALVAETTGDRTTAIELHREGLALCKQLGYEEGRVGHVLALSALGAPEDEPALGDWRPEALDDVGLSASLRTTAGNAALRAGDLERATAFHRDALERYRSLGLTVGAASSLVALADIADARQDHDEAQDLRRQAGDLRQGGCGDDRRNG